MKCLIKDNFQHARMFSHTVRYYIDDLLTPYFIEEISNIYPVELVLKQTTESETEVSYYITIVGQRFRTSVLIFISLTSPF